MLTTRLSTVANCKEVRGAHLYRTDHNNPWDWAGLFGGIEVTFRPILGRYNRKINGWKAFSPASPGKPAKFYTNGASLTLCVERAINEVGLAS